MKFGLFCINLTMQSSNVAWETVMLVQTDAYRAHATRRNELVFTCAEKDWGRDALLHYSSVTGRRWKSICDEILRCSLEPGGSALLTRQDLESWTSGRNALGDQKYALVHDFLTSGRTMSMLRETGFSRPFDLHALRGRMQDSLCRRQRTSIIKFLDRQGSVGEFVADSGETPAAFLERIYPGLSGAACMPSRQGSTSAPAEAL